MFESNTAHLRLHALSKRYHSGVWGVHKLSLQLQKGQLLSIVGPSGCGKTTLLRLIAGFESPQSGDIFLRGQCIARGIKSTPPEQRNIGLVFQEGALFPHLSVRENIGFGLRHPLAPVWNWRKRHGQKTAQHQRVEQLLRLVGLQQESERLPHSLSGGQQQRAALARALAPRPHLLLLDEPFASLDPNLRSNLRQEVQNLLRQEGVSAILVTHDQAEALEFGDEMAVMHAGEIEQQASPSQILNAPNTPFVAGFFGLNQFLPATWHQGFLQTAFGPLCATSTSPAWQEGEVLRIIVPPHRFCMVREGKGIRAVVEKVLWLNGAPRYVMRLENGLVVQTTALTSQLLDLGEVLQLALTKGPFTAFVRA